MRRTVLLLLAVCLAGFPLTASGASRVLTVGDATRLHDGASAFEYYGVWQHVRGAHDGRTGGASARSRTRGSFLRLRFRGSQVRLYAVLGPSGGYGLLSIDRSTAGRADFWDWHVTPRALIYRAWGLAPGIHELTVYVEGDRNAKSTGTYVNVDSVDLVGGSVEPPVRVLKALPPHVLAARVHAVSEPPAAAARIPALRLLVPAAALVAAVFALVAAVRRYRARRRAVGDARPLEAVQIGPAHTFEIAVFRPSRGPASDRRSQRPAAHPPPVQPAAPQHSSPPHLAPQHSQAPVAAVVSAPESSAALALVGSAASAALVVTPSAEPLAPAAPHDVVPVASPPITYAVALPRRRLSPYAIPGVAFAGFAVGVLATLGVFRRRGG